MLASLVFLTALSLWGSRGGYTVVHPWIGPYMSIYGFDALLKATRQCSEGVQAPSTFRGLSALGIEP